mmetsp:Transcript_13911/g.23679  ORF Transcript_13911/g.23679 Transcript_13911/m.23679 type:complete len:115 (-) Transcript_13911:462-806(-)|eukprot:CAMPEP_0168615132 /NCGR_PEP_ID=MMETSP0449_2-20121227/4345_1 /TAXON_ID=1082188 /ORGANISM="Strombidium rassoulzadegani, Strain ras09" /LENGTH=114 /DNA_ID=CAMNT_0008655859 /DNA_START=67 /DNA_END=411 /DNA_ORIENTATION=+
MLSDEFKQSKYAMPENIRRARNIAIALAFVEFFCCIASIALYVRRRSRVILVIIGFAFFSTALGAFSKMRLSYWGLLTHSALTIAVIGGFFIYLMIEILFGTDKSPAGKGGLNE